MKALGIATLIIFCGVLFLYFRGRPKNSPASESPRSAKPSSGLGRDLRLMALNRPLSEWGETPTKEFPRIYGILVDYPIDDNFATILAVKSGAASLYTTSTFGIIGGEGHETVRTAATKLVGAADQYFDDSAPTTEYPYPSSDHVRFYFLTFNGVRFIDTDIATIETGESKYSNLFHLAQEALTELRLATEKSK